MPSSFALGDYFEGFIRSMVASGRYNNASEVVREALRELEDRERERAKDQAELEAFLAESFDQLEAGLGMSVEEVQALLESRRRERAAAQ